MEKLVDAGKAKSIGVSNLNAAQLDRIWNVARIKPVTNQVSDGVGAWAVMAASH